MDVKIIGMQLILNFTNSKLTILRGGENIWNADYTNSKLTILCGGELKIVGMQIILNFTDTMIVN